MDLCILTLDGISCTKLVLYGDCRYNSKTNVSIILASIKFIYSSKRFVRQLMWRMEQNICLRCLDFSVYLVISINQIMRSLFFGPTVSLTVIVKKTAFHACQTKEHSVGDK